ncbi:MAG: ankyrin repeat domain-containing protein [Magnetococcales bacterium]|nr:ankyrin repeat domain-containing protein [Magnetococcales bacterium]
MKIPGLAQFVPGSMISNILDIPASEDDNQPQESDYLSNRPMVSNPDSVITMLDQGERLDGMDLQGQTALMWAALNGEAKIAAHLIAAGADVNATDWWGRSALTFALTYNHKRVVALLIENGANWS